MPCTSLLQAGVMGMHRMVQNIEAMRAADVVVVVTGADGSMVSVVAGMVDTPVVGGMHGGDGDRHCRNLTSLERGLADG